MPGIPHTRVGHRRIIGITQPVLDLEPGRRTSEKDWAAHRDIVIAFGRAPLLYQVVTPIWAQGKPLAQNWQELPEAQLSVRIEAEVQELRGPGWIGITQALDVDAARQAALR